MCTSTRKARNELFYDFQDAIYRRYVHATLLGDVLNVRLYIPRLVLEHAHAVGHQVQVLAPGAAHDDDAVGPLLVRRLAEEGVPEHVQLVDGGTAGMDIGFAMRGMSRVVIVDAATTGTDAGAIFRVPGEALEELPPPQSMNMHSFRWDNALAFARWLLKDEYPEHIEVWLIEAEQLEPGEPLSAPVDEAMEKLVRRLLSELHDEAAALGTL